MKDASQDPQSGESSPHNMAMQHGISDTTYFVDVGGGYTVTCCAEELIAPRAPATPQHALVLRGVLCLSSGGGRCEGGDLLTAGFCRS